MLMIPNQSSSAKAFAEFDEAWRTKPSAHYDRLVDVMEEPVKFTLPETTAQIWSTDTASARKGPRNWRRARTRERSDDRWAARLSHNLYPSRGFPKCFLDSPKMTETSSPCHVRAAA